MTSIAQLVTETRSTTVLAIGPWQHDEFAVLGSQVPASDAWPVAPDCVTACELIVRDELSPELILIAQLLPDSCSQADIERLRGQAPLAQIVVVAGTWCEGELRTGKPAAGVLRLYWHEFATWWETAGLTSKTSHGLDGMLAPRRGYDSNQPMKVGTIAIHSHDLATFAAISEILAVTASEFVWCRDVADLPAQVSVGIWDGGQLDEREFAQLRDFASAAKQRGGGMVVLLDFPRKEHYQKLVEIDCERILSKPYVIEELRSACSPVS